MSEPRDFYEVLGVDRDATPEQLKKAYRRLALKYHPDRAEDPADEEHFKEATHAYEVLADPEKRQIYDQYGYQGLNRMAGGGFSSDAGEFGDIFSGLEDILGGLFGGGRRRGRAGVAAGSDLRYDLDITLEEAAQGVSKTIEIHRLAPCETCQGSGCKPGSSPQTCPQCRGTGQVHYAQGFFTISQPCNQCRGAGRTIKDPCEKCRGQQRVRIQEKIKVTIPAGASSGVRIRIEGHGEAGVGGGPPGSLFVFVTVAEHPLFLRDADNLVCEVPISFTDAALGASIEVPTLLGGNARLKVPAGTQHGQVFKLRHKGLPNLRGHGHGDQLVHVLVEVPTHLTSRQKELLQTFAEESGQEQHPFIKNFWERVKELFTPAGDQPQD